MNMKNFLTGLFLTCFISLTVYSQGTDDSSYQQIRDHIDSNRVTEAQNLLEEWIKINPNDATLQLYQTEIWIQVADQKYKERKLKTAFSYYEKAFANWPNNPSLRSRYMELKDKKLVDHVPSPILKTRYSGFGSSSTEQSSLNIPFQEMNESLKQIRDEIHFLQEKSNSFHLVMTLITVSILLQCFILLKLGFPWQKSKNR
ncbi:tetratricopeptide repeat protein [Leptospira kmetyi]|uniref:tetratricopeptide repeat protein n=1 Tax=Leptospira kmetyi TaxID=408139 RepID=UPI0026C1A055